MAVVSFSNISDLKKQPVDNGVKGFPRPMAAQMESDMPLTEKGEKIMSAMSKEYGAEKGKRVFYASRNKGTIKGVDPESKPVKRRHKVKFPHPSMRGK